MIYTCEPEKSRAQLPACHGMYWKCLSTAQPFTRSVLPGESRRATLQQRDQVHLLAVVPPGKTSRGSPAALPQAPCWALATAQFLTKPSPLPRSELSEKPTLLLLCRLPKPWGALFTLVADTWCSTQVPETLLAVGEMKTPLILWDLGSEIVVC